MGTQTTPKASAPRERATFNSLRERGFFTYIGKNLLLILSVYALVIFIVFLVGKYLVDFNSLFGGIIERLSNSFVILLFFASESFTGMIPVDLFVIWTQKFASPMPWLALLFAFAILSMMVAFYFLRLKKN